MESQHSVVRRVGSRSVRSTLDGHEANIFEVVEWSEQLRPAASFRLGAVRRRVQNRLCTEKRV